MCIRDRYKVSSSWDTNTITWNNQTGIGGTLVSSKFISDSRNKTSGYDTFDVIAWVKSHYSSPSTDYGIRLQPRTVDSSTNRACYISSDYSTTSSRPLILIEYTPAGNAAPGIFSGELYYIRNVNSGKYLDVKNGSREVVQHSFSRGAHQTWKIVYESDGFYSLSPAGSPNNVLDLSNGYTSNGNPIWSYKKWASGTTESNSQRFAISKVGTDAYKIASKKDTNKVVEVQSASTAEDGIVQLWSYVGQTQQQWDFERVETAICSRAVTSIPPDDFEARLNAALNLHDSTSSVERALSYQRLYDLHAAAIVAAMGAASTYPNAADALLHYLNHTGKDYTIPASFILSAPEIAAYRNIVYNDLVDSGKILRVNGRSVTFGRKKAIEVPDTPQSDWRLAWNKCDLWGKSTIGSNGKAQIILQVRDVYDYEPDDTYSIFNIAVEALYDLNRIGLAKPFAAYGSATVN